MSPTTSKGPRRLALAFMLVSALVALVLVVLDAGEPAPFAWVYAAALARVLPYTVLGAVVSLLVAVSEE